jgi:transglutaminase superfamily protein
VNCIGSEPAEFEPLHMKASNLFERWNRLSSSRRRLLVEAFVALGAASAAVWLMPFKRAVRLGSRPLAAKETGRFTADASWAVETAARYVPWRAVCFQKGIALQWMLRRRGVDARLHYGVGRDEAGDLKAHVWVGANDHIIIGGEEAELYQRVATFP